MRWGCRNSFAPISTVIPGLWLVSARTSVRPSAHALAILLDAKSCAAAGGGSDAVGSQDASVPLPSLVIPRLDRGTQYSRRWSRIVCPSDRVLRWVPDHVMDFQSTRSGMTVGENGKAVPGNLHPPWQGKNLRSANLPARERTQARRCLRKPINLLSIVSGKR
jgi:hypothetical protein